MPPLYGYSYLSLDLGSFLLQFHSIGYQSLYIVPYLLFHVFLDLDTCPRPNSSPNLWSYLFVILSLTAFSAWHHSCAWSSQSMVLSTVGFLFCFILFFDLVSFSTPTFLFFSPQSQYPCWISHPCCWHSCLSSLLSLNSFFGISLRSLSFFK